MARIINKLNLNKTPQVVEDNSIIFAKNIKLMKDGMIGRDSGLKKLDFSNNTLILNIRNSIRSKLTSINSRVGSLDIAGIDAVKSNLVDLVEEQEAHIIEEPFVTPTPGVEVVSINSKAEINKELQQELLKIESDRVVVEEFTFKDSAFIETFFDGGVLVGVIPYNTTFYTFWANLTIYSNNVTNNRNDRAFLIIKYDEKTDEVTFEQTGWTWSGGEITGNVIVNLNGDIILNIAEYLDDEHLIPFKSINLNKSSYADDESLYTQTPKIPIANLRYVGHFVWQIPNGTYQFFIRYKIRKGIYTNWMPCSNELFTGNSTKIDTSQGTIKYTDTSKDSSRSFIFNLDIIHNESNLETYQLGFIVAHDDSTYAKIWKEFSISETTVYFDYKEHEGVDEDIDNMLTPIFDIYNVENVVEFKNKLYVSNYAETNFNPDFRDIAKEISVDIKVTDLESSTDPDSRYTFLTEDITIRHEAGSALPDVPRTLIRGINSNSVQDIITHIMSSILPIDDSIVGGEPEESIYEALNASLDEATNGEYLGISYAISDIHKYESIANQGHEGYLYIEHWDNRHLYGGFKEDVRSILYQANTYGYVTNIVDTFSHLAEGLFTYIDPITNHICETYSGTGPLLPTYSDNKYRITLQRQNGSSVSFVITFSVNFSLIDTTVVEDYRTLIPFQKYQFYIHFVKANGESTNGYPVGDEIQAPYKVNSIIYPVFNFSNNFSIPTGYCSFFFSIAHTGNKVIHVTNIHTYTDNLSNVITIGDAPEIDTAMASFALPFTVTLVPDTAESYDDLETCEAEYAASGNGIDVHTFGGNGKILFADDVTNGINDGFIIQESTYNKEDLVLVKCTPYIKSVDDYYEDDYKQYNLLGFISGVYKVDDGIDTYVSGNDYYIKTYESGTPIHLKLDTIDNANSGTVPLALKYGYFVKTSMLYVYSSYNLNYLALTNNTGTPVAVVKSNVIRYTFDSLLLSSMYQVPTMYYNYPRYPFAVYSDDNYTQYDNTIRSSKLQGDEELNYRTIFKSTDYYNMPTNKGIIVKLISVGDAILVHTEDSLFKFSGSNTLSNSGGEDIQTIESEPFDTGVSEIFGSQNGFAGIQDIKACCVSQAGYMFYDNSANRLYYYTSGQQGGLKTISDAIHKLLNYYPIQRVRFGDDFDNNRIFVNIKFKVSNSYKYVTLSFNTITNSFISLHDFTFENSFSTKSKCYFWTKYTKDMYQINNSSVGYSSLTFNDTIYPYKNDDTVQTNKQSIIDIIYNTDYQRVKTLNYINYILSKVSNFASDWTTNVKNKCIAEETLDRHYPGNYIRIYSDSCCTDLIDCSNATSKANASLVSRYSMIKPIYNQGVWSLNVFRNILDITDITQSDNLADNKSLIYGKYFIVRFVFNAGIDFKLENVSFNII